MQRFLCFGVAALILATTPGIVAQQPQAAGAPRAAMHVAARNPAFTSTIQGNALTSTNGQLADALVRLRDARYGRVVETTTTDKSGLFAFHAVDPGSYIVEIMGADETSVLAASQILNVNSGEVVSAIVKLPFRVTPFAGVVAGNAGSSASAISVITQAAANSIVMAATPAGAVDNCPLQKPQ
ncbi:MAG TPA: hypothetical protein VFB07_00740 [Vicinamibacterales bacterium]|nr:hypothetical protein [Vicinamibacterales bacterium]